MGHYNQSKNNASVVTTKTDIKRHNTQNTETCMKSAQINCYRKYSVKV